MPNRILYEKVTVSETVGALTAEEERFFYRLIVKCDDFGRHHARPSLLRAACFPLLLEQITDAMVQDWLSRLEAMDLIRVYEVEERAYLCITTWRRYQRTRATTSKYPDPPIGGILPALARGCAQMPPVSGNVKRNSETYPEDGGDARVAAGPPAAPAPPSSTSTPTPADAGHDQFSAVPAPLASFHAVLVGTQGYEPSPAFFEQVTERYGSLDLREEALKIKSWLADPAQNRRQKSATTNFILGWLKREASENGSRPSPPSRSHHTSAANGDYDPLVGRVRSVTV